MTKHIMLDLETLSGERNALILSLGAVAFTKDRVVDEFIAVVDLSDPSCGKFHINPSTVLWWMQQSEEAKEHLYSKRKIPIIWLLVEFNKFINKHKPKGVWGNGASFDNVVLRECYNLNKIKCPWSYRVDKCYRTIKNGFRPFPEVKFEGVKHNPVDDARYQAQILIQLHKRGDIKL